MIGVGAKWSLSLFHYFWVKILANYLYLVYKIVDSHTKPNFFETQQKNLKNVPKI